MRTISYTSLDDFEPWSGAVSTYDKIRNEDKLDELDAILEEMYPDGMTDTELNDLLWFYSDTVFGWLGIRTEEEIQEEIDEKQERIEEIRGEIDDIMEEMEDCEEEDKEDLENELREIHSEMEELEDEIRELEEELEEY